MRNLLNFLARYNNLIIFLILEGLSFYFLASRTTYHNTRVWFGIRGVTYGFEKKMYDINTYLSLREVNNRLAEENVILKNNLEKLVKNERSSFTSVTDSIFNQQYDHVNAEVIDNSVNKQKNFFTINKGISQGIKADMAVTSAGSIAGVIVGCSENFSVAMSVLNLDFKVSGRLKSSGYFGSVSWDGRDYRQAILSEIPQHVPVNVGDTVVTTGYSAFFPEGLMIGTVSDFKKIGGDFYKISLSLTTEFKKIHFVDVIGNKKKMEILNLQKLIK
jgi:rod shape-determining protein MreC